MSSGSKPATTTGRLWRSTKASKTPQPVIVAAWPAARKPSTCVSGISATISITGGMYLWAESTERFVGQALQDDGGGGDRGRLEAGGEEDDRLLERVRASSTACPAL